MSVSDRLKKIREEKGISQAALSRLCGVSQSAIGYIENGQRSPTEQSIRMLADALGVTPAELLTDGDDQQQAFTVDELRVIESYRRLNAQGKEYIRQQLFMAAQIYTGEHAGLSGVAK